MSNLLWFIIALLSIIPAVTCGIYFFLRLGTRRDQVKQTLISMQLEEYYMKARHGDVQRAERKKLFAAKFNEDFSLGLRPMDYAWPVLLTTVLGFVGWFLTLSRVYPSLSSSEAAATFLPGSFAFGFAGAFAASLLNVFDDFNNFNLEPRTYYSITYRILFSSTAAFVMVKAINLFLDPGQTFDNNAGAPLLAFGIGLFPVEKTWNVITAWTARIMKTASEVSETGAALAVIQGLEDQRNRQKLIDVDISTVQALATADPFWLFFQTTFPLRSVVDMMDKAILYLYIGDKTKDLRTHGINGMIELVALVPLASKKAAYGPMSGTATADRFFADHSSTTLIENLKSVLQMEPQELKAFIYNMYYDPAVRLLYDIWGKYLEVDAEPPETQGQAPAPQPAAPSPQPGQP